MAQKIPERVYNYLSRWIFEQGEQLIYVGDRVEIRGGSIHPHRSPTSVDEYLKELEEVRGEGIVVEFRRSGDYVVKTADGKMYNTRYHNLSRVSQTKSNKRLEDRILCEIDEALMSIRSSIRGPRGCMAD